MGFEIIQTRMRNDGNTSRCHRFCTQNCIPGATTIWDWSPKLEGNSMKQQTNDNFLGIELVEPPKSLGETRGNSKFDGFIPNFVAAFGTCTSRWCHLVSFLMTMCDISSSSYLDMASGLVKFVLCSLKTLSKTKKDVYRSGAVLEQRRWEWENFGWGWKEVKQSGDSKTASRISRLWVDHSRKMSLLAYLAVQKCDPKMSGVDPFQALTSGARVACGTCRWLTLTESTTSLGGQEILRWALPAVALLVGLFVEHAARAELMPLWSSLFVHFL